MTKVEILLPNWNPLTTAGASVFIGDTLCATVPSTANSATGWITLPCAEPTWGSKIKITNDNYLILCGVLVSYD